MAFCPRCGTELQHGEQSCANCGAEVRAGAAADIEYKGVGIRLAAHIVDVILVFIVYFVVGSMIAGATGGATEYGFELQGGPALLLMLITFVVSMSYFIVLESRWNGQTLGKKMAGIRVASADGRAASLRQTTVRNLLRVVDVLPFLYIVGMILIWTGDKRQRLGDRVADTVVLGASKAATEPTE